MLEAETGHVVLLSNRVSASSPLQPHTPLTYTNDLDIAADGTIYFTDSVEIPPHRNAQHRNDVQHIVSILGLPGYYDTVKGWAYGMLQVSDVRQCTETRHWIHTGGPGPAFSALLHSCLLHVDTSPYQKLYEGTLQPPNGTVSHEVLSRTLITSGLLVVLYDTVNKAALVNTLSSLRVCTLALPYSTVKRG